MCSTTGDRLTEIAAAIDELAAGWRVADAAGRADVLARRLADLWALVAELDPGVASRLPGYQSS
jgi:hypothetical protein